MRFLGVFLCLFATAYLWFACNFDFSSFCGWTRETGTGAEWIIQANGAPAVHRGPPLDHMGRCWVLTFFFLSFFELVALDRCFGRVLHSSRCYYASAEKSVETSCARNGNIFNKALNNTIQSPCCCKFTTLPFFCLKKWGKTCLWCKKKFPLDTQPCSYFEGQKPCEYGNISQS